MTCTTTDIRICPKISSLVLSLPVDPMIPVVPRPHPSDVPRDHLLLLLARWDGRMAPFWGADFITFHPISSYFILFHSISSDSTFMNFELSFNPWPQGLNHVFQSYNAQEDHRDSCRSAGHIRGESHFTLGNIRHDLRLHPRHCHRFSSAWNHPITRLPFRANSLA